MLQKLTDSTQFTNKNIVFAQPGRHQITGTTGLYLWVSQDGDTRRWIYRYTSPATRRVTETGLGLWPAISLSDAKAKADGLRKQISNGICPITSRREERTSRVTFKETCEGWIETHKAAWKNVDSEDDRACSQLRNCNVLLFTHGKALANKPVASITPDMVQDALKGLWAKYPLQGRRALAMIARVFDFARAKGFRQGQNPCEWKGLFEYRLPRVRKTDRGHFPALPYEQMPTFMKELRQKQGRGVGSVALEFTILTCARTSEVLGMTWDEINWEKKTWTVPATRIKSGREHVVPLCARAIELLTLQRQHSNGSEFVFVGYRQTRMEERTMRSILKRMDLKVTCHGFRSTFRDWAGDITNFPREHVEACLAHRVGSAVELAYRRQTALEKRREILNHWAAFCAGDAALASAPTAQAAE
jgi:integrase